MGYKRHQNYIWIPRKRRRLFARAAETPAEMRRLVDELNSAAFVRAHPATQAAFAHYALVSIHPFRDGNGRAARLLATVYTLRSHGVAPLILVANGRDYVGALLRANADDYLPLADFMVRSCRGAVARWLASIL